MTRGAAAGVLLGATACGLPPLAAPRSDRVENALIPAGNLTGNPSFEVDVSGWFPWNATVARVVLDAGAPDGVAIARVSYASALAFSLDDAPDTVPSATAGRIYQASAWVRAGSPSSVGKLCELAVRERDPTSTNIVHVWQGFGALTSTFQHLVSYGEVMTSGDGIDVYVFHNDGGSGDAMDVDAVTLVDVTDTSIGLIADDFESGALSGPQTPWKTVFAQPGNSWSVDRAAAHRGQLGARFVDTTTTGSRASEGQLLAPLQRLTGDLYARFWVRLTLSGTDSLYISAFASDVPYDLAEVEVDAPSLQVATTGFDSSSVWSQSAASSQLTNAAWHLVEFALTGAGTASGGRKLWVDGTLWAEQSGLSFAGPNGEVASFDLGEPWSENRASQGTYDFDDVRVSLAPPASSLTVGVAAGAMLGSCVPVTVGLVDSSGRPASAPYPVTVDLSVALIASRFYGDERCATPVPGAVIDTDTRSATVYLRADTAGSAWIYASQLDFLSGSAPLTVVDDTGPKGSPPQGERVGCGCTDAGSLSAIAWAALALISRRRRSARPSPRPRPAR
jgi:uncharacterized protein (TIGR03382 family)